MEFREFKTDFIKKEVEKQYKAAKKVQETMINAELKDCPEGFELTKEMLISNESGGVLWLLQEIFTDYFSGGFKWLGIAVSFMLGIMSTLITDNDKNVLSNGLVGSVIALMIIGYVIDVARKTVEKRVEKLTIRILNAMSYERYRFLLSSEQEVEATDE